MRGFLGSQRSGKNELWEDGFTEVKRSKSQCAHSKVRFEDPFNSSPRITATTFILARNTLCKSSLEKLTHGKGLQ